MVMNETEFYGSKKHFDTEMSYEEYLDERRRKRKAKSSQFGSSAYAKQLNKNLKKLFGGY